jgi:hypothetical protein
VLHDDRFAWDGISSVPISAGGTSSIVTAPGILVSPFYGYAGAYVAADTVHPGRGYWVIFRRRHQVLGTASFRRRR